MKVLEIVVGFVGIVYALCRLMPEWQSFILWGLGLAIAVALAAAFGCRFNPFGDLFGSPAPRSFMLMRRRKR